MKKLNSLRAWRKRGECQVVRRKRRLFVISKIKKFKARQG